MQHSTESTAWNAPTDAHVGGQRSDATTPVDLDDLPLPVYQARPDGKILKSNAALRSLLGGEQRQILPSKPRLPALLETPAEWKRIMNLVERNGRVDGFETRIQRFDGEWIWVEHNLRRIPTDFSVKLDSLLGSMRNISRWKEREEQLRHDALHDPLTELPTRSVFFSRLEQALNRLKRRRKELVAILFLDLDGFKEINDRLGHLAGDAVLISVAERVRECLRPEDTFCRFGGDEFAVILEGLHHTEAVSEVAERIRSTVIQPVPLSESGREAFVDVSIGFALARSGEEEPETLVRHADQAMYRAKAAGGGTFRKWDAADASGDGGDASGSGSQDGSPPERR